MDTQISYSKWREHHRSILERLSNSDVFLLFSGGKDSSLCLHLMLEASQEFGFDLEAHAGAFPVHRYTDTERRRLGDYWEHRGVRVIWHTIEETDDGVENAPNPCLFCQKVRKKMLHTILSQSVENWEKLVLVPSYSLWDIASYAVEHLLGDVFSNGKDVGEERSKRFIETAQRFYPFASMKEGYSIFRPLVKYNGNDIVRAVKKQGIPFLSIPCKFKDYRPKRILERYYEKMALCFDYQQVLDFARRSLNLPDISSYDNIEKEEYFKNIF
ncbi:MAG: hypothetical protein JRI84_04300 [Deltaproteobacteria bacterium]|nr:hypothetical protein [Deltaproteobacteria bacterium]